MISVSKIHYCIDMGQYKSIQVIKREPSTHATCGFAIPSPSGRAREGLELGRGFEEGHEIRYMKGLYSFVH
jgi:hypothetical protein